MKRKLKYLAAPNIPHPKKSKKFLKHHQPDLKVKFVVKRGYVNNFKLFCDAYQQHNKSFSFHFGFGLIIVKWRFEGNEPRAHSKEELTPEKNKNVLLFQPHHGKLQRKDKRTSFHLISWREKFWMKTQKRVVVLTGRGHDTFSASLVECLDLNSKFFILHHEKHVKKHQKLTVGL